MGYACAFYHWAQKQIFHPNRGWGCPLCRFCFLRQVGDYRSGERDG